MLTTLGLIGVFLIALAGEPDGWGALGPEHLVVALHWVGVAVLWWLGVGCSPLAGRVVAASDYYPLATVVAALATARIVTRHTHRESWHELALAGRPPFRVDGAPAVDPGLRADAPGRGIHEGFDRTGDRDDLDPRLADAGSDRDGDRMAADRVWGRHRLVGGMGRHGPDCRAATRVGGRRAASDVRLGRRADGRVRASGPGRLAAPGSLAGERAGARGPWPRTHHSPLPRAWAVEFIAFASSLVAAVTVLAAGTSTPAPEAGGPPWVSA